MSQTSQWSDKKEAKNVQIAKINLQFLKFTEEIKEIFRIAKEKVPVFDTEESFENFIRLSKIDIAADPQFLSQNWVNI